MAEQRRLKIIVVCATGVATSTMVMSKLKDLLARHDIPATLHKSRTSEAKSAADGADLVISTTQIPWQLGIPVIRAHSLLTGLGEAQTIEEILSKARDILNRP
ncbi:MAG: PTS sugar transporter subunit IIB [Actinobacteria bacterium]|nr:PTS sugar transporter subunit IIB [Actinomycetota bacterium]